MNGIEYRVPYIVGARFIEWVFRFNVGIDFFISITSHWYVGRSKVRELIFRAVEENDESCIHLVDLSVLPQN